MHVSTQYVRGEILCFPRRHGFECRGTHGPWRRRLNGVQALGRVHPLVALLLLFFQSTRPPRRGLRQKFRDPPAARLRAVRIGGSADWVGFPSSVSSTTSVVARVGALHCPWVGRGGDKDAGWVGQSERVTPHVRHGAAASSRALGSDPRGVAPLASAFSTEVLLLRVLRRRSTGPSRASGLSSSSSEEPGNSSSWRPSASRPDESERLAAI